jgi:hypothetical protein
MEEGAEGGDETTFVVDGATAVEAPVDETAVERWVGPAIEGAGGNGVEVSDEQKGGGAGWADADEDVGALGVDGDEVDGEAAVGGPGGDGLGDGALGVDAVDGGRADESLEERDEIGVEIGDGGHGISWDRDGGGRRGWEVL